MKIWPSLGVFMTHADVALCWLQNCDVFYMFCTSTERHPLDKGYILIRLDPGGSQMMSEIVIACILEKKKHIKKCKQKMGQRGSNVIGS